MSEVVVEPGNVEKKAEKKLDKKVLMGVAAVALAGAQLLGMSGKPESGVGIGVEVLDPRTGRPVSIGVTVSSTNQGIPLGLPQIPGKDYEDIDAFSVRIAGEMITVYRARLTGDNGVKTLLGVYPGFETLR